MTKEKPNISWVSGHVSEHEEKHEEKNILAVFNHKEMLCFDENPIFQVIFQMVPSGKHTKSYWKWS